MKARNARAGNRVAFKNNSILTGRLTLFIFTITSRPKGHNTIVNTRRLDRQNGTARNTRHLSGAHLRYNQRNMTTHLKPNNTLNARLRGRQTLFQYRLISAIARGEKGHATLLNNQPLRVVHQNTIITIFTTHALFRGTLVIVTRFFFTLGFFLSTYRLNTRNFPLTTHLTIPVNIFNTFIRTTRFHQLNNMRDFRFFRDREIPRKLGVRRIRRTLANITVGFTANFGTFILYLLPNIRQTLYDT